MIYPLLTKNISINVRRGFFKMNNISWEVFKKTGSIDAYLYFCDCKNIHEEIEEVREKKEDDDNPEHPGDST